ncbi:formylglycine-generating enzyme family protein [Acinetobacter gyllenbergii]|uniref:formylglycine-generating enzyme family protein n=1 Tax=Acinetobacter gyllenbergii TaxID=134534 RepID=UPI00080684DB|nr:SUMF1/EgtB/PvdO family nonheme iron enzyme [Acinetobacter gyllenbergii]OBY74360.1 hypothetical protein NG55_11095 [Acinetobacter gyllenbergii]
MMMNKLLGLLLLCTALTACAKEAPATQSATKPTLDAETQRQLQQLLDQTRKNMIFVQGGSYMMGNFTKQLSPEVLKTFSFDTSGDIDPLHKVTLDSFSMSAHKATFAELDIYSKVTGKPRVSNSEDVMRYRLPQSAAGMTWQQAQDYCQWLGTQLKLPMGLPTEAQWEYVARNRGQNVLYATDNGKFDEATNIPTFERRSVFSAKYLTSRTLSNPGQFKPTPLGFYDLISENYEWMQDWYDRNYYAHSPEHNPQGPASGSKKVLRSAHVEDEFYFKYTSSFSINRYAKDPVIDPESKSDGMTPDYTNFNNSARCVVNSTQPLK